MTPDSDQTAATESAADAALRLLGSRHSVGPKHLAAPGPSDEQVRRALATALRAPDHGKRVPFRFVVARDAGLERLAMLFVDYGRRCGKSEDELAMERDRAIQAPVVIAVVARIDDSIEVPAHEQWITVGGALTNVLNALHFMGFGAKMLSGLRAADPRIVEAFCTKGERLAGWISVGTPRTAPASRETRSVSDVSSAF